MQKKNNQQQKKVTNSVSQASMSMVYHKSKGQHILINPQVLNGIVEKSAIRSTDTILEIGPGTGNLTQLLLEKGKKVIAIEIDPRMHSELTKRFKYSQWGHKFELIQGDALTTEFPYFDICVANIPYQISSPLVFKLLSHRPIFRHAVLMFQKEFAMRLVAKPNNDMYCRLAANVALLAKCDHVMKVGKNNFRPPPKVESSIVRIEPKNPPPAINYLEWDGLLRTCFIRKNKQLGAIFKQKKVMAILEKNYHAFQKMTDINGNIINDEKNVNDLISQFAKLATQAEQQQGKSELKEQNDDENDDDGDEMKVEEEVKNPFKEKLMNILNEINFRELRSIKLDVSDFLKLLDAFNRNGIHFK